MLEIKTIFTKVDDCAKFDKQVNEALADGWELVRRDIIPPRIPDRYTLLYAELERMIEAEEPEDVRPAEWVVTRNPSAPYRCNVCGHSTATPAPQCPECRSIMASYRG